MLINATRYYAACCCHCLNLIAWCELQNTFCGRNTTSERERESILSRPVYRHEINHPQTPGCVLRYICTRATWCKVSSSTCTMGENRYNLGEEQRGKYENRKYDNTLNGGIAARLCSGQSIGIAGRSFQPHGRLFHSRRGSRCFGVSEWSSSWVVCTCCLFRLR